MLRLASLAAAALAVALLATPASAAPRLTQIGSFDTPVYVTAPPGDPHRLFVVEKEGRIIELRDGQRVDPPFLDITPEVVSGGERGLLSMAFALDYATSGRFYVYYTAPLPGDSSGSIITVEEFPARRKLVEIEHPTYSNHDGGQLQFGPDGALYAGTGDGGSSNDPRNNAQTDRTGLGKLLRIDTATGIYTEHAKGLRNPWRFSFDRQTGDLVIADVGQNYSEEVNFAPAGTGAGQNYGWRCFEGLRNTGLSCSTRTGMTEPVLEKVQSETGFCAIVGGYVVRDPALAPLTGRYLYGDNCASEIRSAALALPRVTDDSDTGLRVDGLTSFGEDSCGHVYAASGLGPVYRLDGDTFTPCPEPAPPPDTRAPVLAVGGKRVQRVARRRGVRIALRCDETCGATARGRVRIGRAKKRLRLRPATRQLAANTRTKAKLRTSKKVRRKIRRALRRDRRVRITVKVTARDAAGNATVKRRRIRARR
jgi:hypothetical protein